MENHRQQLRASRIFLDFLGTVLLLWATCASAMGQPKPSTIIQVSSTGPWEGDTVKVPYYGEARLIAGAERGDSLRWSTKWKTPAVFVKETGWQWVDVFRAGIATRDSVYVLISPPSIELPTTVSPNSENGNDCLWTRIEWPVMLDELKVFNRWGSEVYSTMDPKACWDLKVKGELVPEGTYYYTVKFINHRAEYQTATGTVTVLR